MSDKALRDQMEMRLASARDGMTFFELSHHFVGLCHFATTERLLAELIASGSVMAKPLSPSEYYRAGSPQAGIPPFGPLLSYHLTHTSR